MPTDAHIRERVGEAPLHELVRRRRELAFQLGQHRVQIHNLSAELRQLDTEIGRAGTDDFATVSINTLFTRRLGEKNGELSRMIADMFAESPQGLTSRAIALRVMAILDLDTTDRKAMRYVVGRICVALWVLEQKGHVRKQDCSRTPQLWQWRKAV